MRGVCISIMRNDYIITDEAITPHLRMESTPVVCLIQLEGTLMSMLGYILEAIGVSSLPMYIIVQINRCLAFSVGLWVMTEL